MINHVWEIANKAREDWEGEVSTRATQAQTSSPADTHALLAAVGMGKGLKVSYNQKKKIYLSLKKSLYGHYCYPNTSIRCNTRSYFTFTV